MSISGAKLIPSNNVPSRFNGLSLSSSSRALLNGMGGSSWWFYAVGYTQLYKGGNTAYLHHSSGAAAKVAVKRTQLFVDTCISNEWYRGIMCSGYRGIINYSNSGTLCQKWTDQEPHTHNRTSEIYHNYGLGDHNYCRNPDNASGGAWCYTTDPNTRWEYCTCGMFTYYISVNVMSDI